MQIQIRHLKMQSDQGLCHSVCTSWTYRKFPKYSDTQKICWNHSKIWTMWFYHRVMSPNDADGIPNTVDPDQTAPLGAVWSGSALFAQAYLSKNLGSLRYYSMVILRQFLRVSEFFVFLRYRYLNKTMVTKRASSWENTCLRGLRPR